MDNLIIVHNNPVGTLPWILPNSRVVCNGLCYTYVFLLAFDTESKPLLLFSRMLSFKALKMHFVVWI